MISNNSTVLVLSDSIFARGSNSLSNPAKMIMDTVDVCVCNMSSEGVPVGRLSQAAHIPIAMCDQKTALNYMAGFYGTLECLIVFGGANDWIWGEENVANNYFAGLTEIGLFASQVGIENIVFVSPLGVLSGELNENNGVYLSDLRTKCEDAVNALTSLFGISGVHYIDGLSLMPVIAANYELDELHPNDTGRAIWVNNLIDELQTLGIFPADYV
jgi:hypothetical protein